MSAIIILGRLLAPVALRAAEAAIESISRRHPQRPPHYYRSMREPDGTWINEDYCANCGTHDPSHRLYTDPPCPGAP